MLLFVLHYYRNKRNTYRKILTWLVKESFHMYFIQLWVSDAIFQFASV